MSGYWLFFRRRTKEGGEASVEMATVVSSYMLGQLITSLLCGIYVFAILSVLHVPNAALLAVIAGSSTSCR
jgi:predicted PurR-regulated permease PerM